MVIFSRVGCARVGCKGRNMVPLSLYQSVILSNQQLPFMEPCKTIFPSCARASLRKIRFKVSLSLILRLVPN